MEFFIALPRHPLLRTRIQHIISARGYQPLHQRERLLPDACIDIVIDLTERPKALFEGPTGPERARFRGAWVSGLRQTPYVIEAQADTDFVILRLTVPGAFALLGGVVTEIVDQVVPLDAILGNAVEELREGLAHAWDAPERFSVAEAWLLRMMQYDARPEVGWMIAQMATSPGIRLADLMDRTGFSERTVRQVFRAQTGLQPKRFQRLTRFRSVLDALGHGRGESVEDRLLTGAPLARPDWAGLAAAYGYTDQSHLHAEFTAFSGLTPGRYSAQFRGHTNHLPVDC